MGMGDIYMGHIYHIYHTYVAIYDMYDIYLYMYIHDIITLRRITIIRIMNINNLNIMWMHDDKKMCLIYIYVPTINIPSTSMAILCTTQIGDGLWQSVVPTDLRLVKPMGFC